MKTLTFIAGLLVATTAVAQLPPPEATQAETDAGVIGSKYISPRRGKNASWAGSGGGGGGTFTNVTVIQTNATTAQIQSAFDTGGTIWFTPSVYPYALTTNIYITNSVVVFGNNNVFTPSSLTVSNFLFDTRTNVPAGSVTFRDCKFDGGVHNAYSATSNYFSLLNGTPTLYYNGYWSNRSGMRLSSQPGGLLQNCRFYRWPGNGLMLVNQGSTGAYTNGRVEVADCRFFSNFCGVYLPGSAYETAGYYNNSAPWQQAVPEYQPIRGCEFYQNYMGLGGGAANGHIIDCMFTANIIGTHLTASINNGAHGIYDANTWNHNQYGFWAESCQLGGFRNNRLLGNTWASFIGSSITECQIEANWFGSGSMIISNVSTGFFSRNAYQGSWSNSFACAITNAVKVCGNYSTTVAGNNDGISCNNTNVYATQYDMTTNLTTYAGPDFAFASQWLVTNEAFVVLAPKNVDSSREQVTCLNITNTTATAKAITAPANCVARGVWYVTNLTRITFDHIGPYNTNAVADPIF